MVVVLCMVAVGVVGFIAGRQLENPDDAARRADPPAPSQITAPVELRTLVDRLVIRGDLVLSDSVVLAIAPPEISDGPPVVTGVAVAQGSVVTEGSALVEVNGRPTLVMVGASPMYRDLRVGMTGPDVNQLESGLDRLGFAPGPIDGRYDSRTARAVDQWYRSLGSSPPQPTEAERQGLEDARNAARDARDAYTSLPNTPDLPASEVAAALEQANAATERSNALAALTDTWIPRRELIFVSSLPRSVQSIDGSVGATAAAVTITLVGGDPTVHIDLARESAARLAVGSAVILDDASTEWQGAGTIGFLAETVGTDGAAPGLIRAVILAGPDALSEVGRNIRITIELTATEGQVLAVPISAVFTRADGQTYVRVVELDGVRDIPVDLGMVADGWVEVLPEAQGGVEPVLGEGQEVVVSA